MRNEDFNRMLAAAIDLVKRYHLGAKLDKETVRWAQDLIAANPGPKRSNMSLRAVERIAEQFSPQDEINGLTIMQLCERAPNLNNGDTEFIGGGPLQRRLGRLAKAGHIFLLQRRRLPSLYFLTAQARDQVRAEPARRKAEQKAEIQRRREERVKLRADKRAAEALAKKQAKEAKAAAARVMPPAPVMFPTPMFPAIPRLATTPRPRQHVKREPELVRLDHGVVDGSAGKVLKRPTKAQQIPATLFAPKTANARVNPDQGGAWAPKPKASQEVVIPPGLQVTVCPGYRAPHERWADERQDGAGFAAEWARLRGA